MPFSKVLNLRLLQATASVTLLIPPGHMANKDFIVNFIERKCAYHITAAGAGIYPHINTACVDFSFKDLLSCYEIYPTTVFLHLLLLSAVSSIYSLSSISTLTFHQKNLIPFRKAISAQGCRQRSLVLTVVQAAHPG